MCHEGFVVFLDVNDGLTVYRQRRVIVVTRGVLYEEERRTDGQLSGIEFRAVPHDMCIKHGLQVVVRMQFAFHGL